MAQTSIGTVFLYEVSDEDVAAYAQRRDLTAPHRIRWLLERVASKSSSDAPGTPPPLGADEVASLAPSEIETLFEVYLASPGNQWFQMKSLEANNPVVRGGGESATAFFDRLIDWYAGFRGPGAAVGEAADAILPGDSPGERLEQVAARIQASQRSMETSLRWALGTLVLALAVLSAGASWLGYQSHVRDRENDTRNAAWQQQMKLLAENNSAMERAFTEMASENARLKSRLETLEPRRPGAPAKASSAPAPRNVAAKAPAKPGRAPPRKQQ